MRKILAGLTLSFAFAALATSAPVRVAHLYDISELGLVDIGLTMTLVASGGDSLGNGGGEDKKMVIEAETRVREFISVCISSRICDPTSAETRYLQTLSDTSSFEAPIEFKTTLEDKNLLVAKNKERLFFTGGKVGAPNVINSKILYVEDPAEALILVLSIYSFHHPEIKIEIKKQALALIANFRTNLGVDTAFTEWSQRNLKVYEYDDQHSLIFADGESATLLTAENIGLESQCIGAPSFKITPFSWTSIFAGYAEAVANFSIQCPPDRSVQRGRIQFTVFFTNNLDWTEFYVHPNHFLLKIRDVSWQTFYY